MHCRVSCLPFFRLVLVVVLVGIIYFVLVCLIRCVLGPMAIDLLHKCLQERLGRGLSIGDNRLCKLLQEEDGIHGGPVSNIL